MEMRARGTSRGPGVAAARRHRAPSMTAVAVMARLILLRTPIDAGGTPRMEMTPPRTHRMLMLPRPTQRRRHAGGHRPAGVYARSVVVGVGNIGRGRAHRPHMVRATRRSAVEMRARGTSRGPGVAAARRHRAPSMTAVAVMARLILLRTPIDAAGTPRMEMTPPRTHRMLMLIRRTLQRRRRSRRRRRAGGHRPAGVYARSVVVGVGNIGRGRAHRPHMVRATRRSAVEMRARGTSRGPGVAAARRHRAPSVTAVAVMARLILLGAPIDAAGTPRMEMTPPRTHRMLMLPRRASDRRSRWRIRIPRPRETHQPIDQHHHSQNDKAKTLRAPAAHHTTPPNNPHQSGRPSLSPNLPHRLKTTAASKRSQTHKTHKMHNAQSA